MLSPPRSPKNLRGKCHLLKNGTTCSSSLCIFGGKVASGKLFLNKLTSVTNVTKQELQLKYFAEELFIYLFNCSGLLSWHLLDPLGCWGQVPFPEHHEKFAFSLPGSSVSGCGSCVHQRALVRLSRFLGVTWSEGFSATCTTPIGLKKLKKCSEFSWWKMVFRASCDGGESGGFKQSLNLK